jgi:acid phosphatase type 7
MTFSSFFRIFVLFAAMIMAAALLALAEPSERPALAQASNPQATLVGTGDIASCSHNRDFQTAKLVNSTLATANAPVTVFNLGDNAYPDGTAAQFRDCYDPTWGGSHLGARADITKKVVNPLIYDRTRPVVGNHEYHTPDASAYFVYFGAKAGNRTKGYYSYDLGDWHFVVLNSNCDQVGCGWFSTQGSWLRADLANNPASCTVASFHHPLYTSSTADTSTVRPFWDMLYNAGVDVILSGHAHYYERFAPQRPNGSSDPTYGIREFVVGTGGAAPSNPMRFPRAANSVIDSEKEPGKTAYGVLKLGIYTNSYAWKFLPIDGETFTDSGTGQCHGKP